MKSVCRYPFLYLNRSGKKNKMYLMIDNYDSFVYNLKAYFEELGRTVVLRRTDKITLEEIDKMNLDGIIREYLCNTESVTETIIYKNEIEQYEECFITNSLMGIMPVRQLAKSGLRSEL